MGHPVLSLLESQWKLRQQHDHNFPWGHSNGIFHCRINTGVRRKKEIQKSRTSKVTVRDPTRKVQDALSGLTPFLATGSPFKMMKNALYFNSKTISVLKIFKFLSWLFGHVTTWVDKKDKVNFKFYEVTAWSANKQYTYCPIFREVKGIRQLNLVI